MGPLAGTEERWQQIENRLASIERRIQEQSSTAIATLDACLARLDALRHTLVHQPWPPQTIPTPAAPPTAPPQQPAHTGSHPRRRTQTAPDAPQHGLAGSHQAAVPA
ncbi:hypothetical protein [Kitasatospora sp. NPDC085879]|uniref:hypothetical protein n=1 Tax=Kitasatospora sp. NPDC085879 TaxID=3154769 RepID=UPI000BB10322|nr:hypothetical protein [Streptomyces sp. TLI_235]PBC70063.1 hypothetical protein BX265_7449 [Streptomyces sp. TLI_235]